VPVLSGRAPLSAGGAQETGAEAAGSPDGSSSGCSFVRGCGRAEADSSWANAGPAPAIAEEKPTSLGRIIPKPGLRDSEPGTVRPADSTGFCAGSKLPPPESGLAGAENSVVEAPAECPGSGVSSAPATAGLRADPGPDGKDPDGNRTASEAGTMVPGSTDGSPTFTVESSRRGAAARKIPYAGLTTPSSVSTGPRPAGKSTGTISRAEADGMIPGLATGRERELADACAGMAACAGFGPGTAKTGAPFSCASSKPGAGDTVASRPAPAISLRARDCWAPAARLDLDDGSAGTADEGAPPTSFFRGDIGSLAARGIPSGTVGETAWSEPGARDSVASGPAPAISLCARDCWEPAARPGLDDGSAGTADDGPPAASFFRGDIGPVASRRIPFGAEGQTAWSKPGAGDTIARRPALTISFCARDSPAAWPGLDDGSAGTADDGPPAASFFCGDIAPVASRRIPSGTAGESAWTKAGAGDTIVRGPALAISLCARDLREPAARLGLDDGSARTADDGAPAASFFCGDIAPEASRRIRSGMGESAGRKPAAGDIAARGPSLAISLCAQDSRERSARLGLGDGSAGTADDGTLAASFFCGDIAPVTSRRIRSGMGESAGRKPAAGDIAARGPSLAISLCARDSRERSARLGLGDGSAGTADDGTLAASFFCGDIAPVASRRIPSGTAGGSPWTKAGAGDTIARGPALAITLSAGDSREPVVLPGLDDGSAGIGNGSAPSASFCGDAGPVASWLTPLGTAGESAWTKAGAGDTIARGPALAITLSAGDSKEPAVLPGLDDGSGGIGNGSAPSASFCGDAGSVASWLTPLGTAGESAWTEAGAGDTIARGPALAITLSAGDSREPAVLPGLDDGSAGIGNGSAPSASFCGDAGSVASWLTPSGTAGESAWTEAPAGDTIARGPALAITLSAGDSREPTVLPGLDDGSGGIGNGSAPSASFCGDAGPVAFWLTPLGTAGESAWSKARAGDTIACGPALAASA